VGEPAPGTAELGAVPFAEAEAAGSPERGFPARSGDDQFIIYTGGTTGMPKGVMWRQEDLFFSGLGGGAPTGEPVKSPQELAERVAAGGDGITFFPTPPLMHGTSTLTAFIGFNFGQRVVIHRKFTAEDVLRTIEKEKVTSVSLVGDAMLRPLIDALNEDLSREYQAIISYVNYSQVLKGAAYMNIAAELAIHAKEELDHALQVANHVDYLGGMPSVTPKPVKTSEKAEDMLKFDLENEKETIRNYRRRVKQAEVLNEYAIAESLRGILMQEQDHLIALATALGIDAPDPGIADE
jgi:bacterioferritin (cytochrome b1)